MTSYVHFTMTMFATTLALLFILRLRFPRSTPISDTLRRRYGNDCLRIFRRYEQITKKFNKAELDISFLTSCIAYDLIPDFLQFKLYKKSLTEGNLYKELQRKLLSDELNTRKADHKRLTTQIATAEEELRCQVSRMDFYALRHHVSIWINKFTTTVKQTHESKLERLGGKLKLESCDPSKVVFNFSDRMLNDRERFLLSFGLKFNLPIYRPSFYKYFLYIEKLFHVLSRCTIRRDFDFNVLQRNITGRALSLFYGFKTHKVFSPIFNKSDFAILKSLGNDENIVICSPDKGRGVVVLNKHDYISKMMDILSDTCKFIKVTTTDIFLTTLHIEDKINRFLNKLKTAGAISNEIYKQLYASGSSPGLLYGLAKIHKNNVPMRPILAAYKTATYKLGKFLIPLIEPFTQNGYTLKNSYDFVDIIQGLKLSSSNFMVSLDIKSLYTNVPVIETINILITKIFGDNEDVSFHNFTKHDLTEFLKLTVLNSYFIFNNSLFKQIDGLSMGNPISPALANVFLCHMEERIFNSCPNHFKPLFYKRYLDDTFVIFKDESSANNFLEFVNSIHPNLEFTIEKESNNVLPFLDVNVTREQNCFNTSVYRKPTFTGLCNSYFSFCPTVFKLNAIKTLIFRAYHISSNFTFFHNEIVYLKQLFSNNGYPSKIVDVFVKKFLNKIYSSATKTHTVSKQSIYIPLLYLGPPSVNFVKYLSQQLCKFYPQISFHFAMKNSHTIDKYFKFKDKIPTDLCSNVIYEFRCALCNECYIGSTSKQYKIRVYQHLGKSPRTNRPVSTLLHSSPREHCFNNSHPFNSDNFKIIDSAVDSFDLRILESIYIFKNKPTLNIDQSAVPLYSF